MKPVTALTGKNDPKVVPIPVKFGHVPRDDDDEENEEMKPFSCVGTRHLQRENIGTYPYGPEQHDVLANK